VTPLLLAASRTFPVRLLEETGVRLDEAQRTQAILLGDEFPAADLKPAQRLQVLLSDLSHGDTGADAPMALLVALAARAFGVRVAMVDPDGEVTFIGDPTGSTPSVLLVQDGDHYLAGRPGRPKPVSPPTPDPVW